jgi:glycosyltransferase involved in cell wall biosynthesis
VKRLAHLHRLEPGGEVASHYARRVSQPKVSVIVASYNEEATLGRTVASALAQTVSEVEVIVVDDGSAVPASEVLAGTTDPRLRIVRHESNRGLSHARNTGLHLTSAPLMSPLDADDEWVPTYLETVLPRFADPRIGMVYANATVLASSGTWPYIADPAAHPVDAFPELARACWVPQPTVTMRTGAVRDAGGYATWLWGAQDWHLYCKLVVAGWRFAFIDEELAIYRFYETPESMSFDQDRMKVSILRMWAGFFARHPLTWRAYVPVAQLTWRGARKKIAGAFGGAHASSRA